MFPFSATPEGRIRAMIDAIRRQRALAQAAGSTEGFEQIIQDESALDRLIKARMGRGF